MPYSECDGLIEWPGRGGHFCFLMTKAIWNEMVVWRAWTYEYLVPKAMGTHYVEQHPVLSPWSGGLPGGCIWHVRNVERSPVSGKLTSPTLVWEVQGLLVSCSDPTS